MTNRGATPLHLACLAGHAATAREQVDQLSEAAANSRPDVRLELLHDEVSKLSDSGDRRGDALRACVAKLPAAHRQLVTLRYYEDLEIDGVAERFGGAVCLAARAHGLEAFDSVYNNFTDAAGFAAECAHGRALGFDGKTLIHPGQIEACNAAFAPRADEIAWARAVIAAFEAPENAGKGAVALKGAMIERLHLEGAARIGAIANSLAPT